MNSNKFLLTNSFKEMIKFCIWLLNTIEVKRGEVCLFALDYKDKNFDFAHFSVDHSVFLPHFYTINVHIVTNEFASVLYKQRTKLQKCVSLYSKEINM